MSDVPGLVVSLLLLGIALVGLSYSIGYSRGVRAVVAEWEASQ